MSADGKACTKCGVWKGFCEFHKNSKHADGLATQCKVCICEKRRAERSDPSVRSELAKLAREYRAKYPEKIKEQRVRWRSNNLDKCREKDRNRYWNNKEYEIERSKQYAAKSRDKHRAKINSRLQKYKETSRKELLDWYVRSAAGLPSDAPAGLVETARERLQLRRLLRDFQQALSDEGNTK